MPYADYYQQLDYYNTWYYEIKDKHLKQMTKYFYDNRSKILDQRKLMMINVPTYGLYLGHSMPPTLWKYTEIEDTQKM